ncbi:DUF6456 domain-containing protein [Rhizobium sp. GN54]|uniref:DUF6456 domain-containing protein n=1 Tax=Rhizobium sp. GN54 TaxID=2898150 RepID=UPI001E2F1439|nr:DUF6456 domain-containing protein [Rhizobium sp. GN54]MCD2180948.1 DUF6456 domain-containing protein [Rhizobium sp. GN54]
MNKPSAIPAKRPLAALLRFLAAASEAEISGEDPVRLVAAGGRQATASASVVTEALRLGLAIREGGMLRASPETRSHLRRLMAGADNYLDQHRDIAERTLVTAAGSERVSVNQLESPLAALSRLKDKAGAPFLPEAAIAAGERLARDFTRAGLQPRLTMRWEPRLAGRDGGDLCRARELSDTALAARGRLQQAIAAMGPELSGAALDVCCFMKGLETVERERQWPARSAKLMLRAALMALSRHYAPERSPKPRSHSWGAEGYRPELAGRLDRPAAPD